MLHARPTYVNAQQSYASGANCVCTCVSVCVGLRGFVCVLVFSLARLLVDVCVGARAAVSGFSRHSRHTNTTHHHGR